MARKKSPSVARSGPRAEGRRVARLRARLARELGAPPQDGQESLESAMGSETLKRVGGVLHEFASSVADKRSRSGERTERLILTGAVFPPLF